jgi:hypothetical protein
MPFDPKKKAKFITTSDSPVSPAMLTTHTPGYNEMFDPHGRDATRAAEQIKSSIENLIAHKRSCQHFEWWTESHDKSNAEAIAQLRKALKDWKIEHKANGVDVEKTLREVFTSPAGRVWETDPHVKVLALDWALGPESEK